MSIYKNKRWITNQADSAYSAMADGQLAVKVWDSSYNLYVGYLGTNYPVTVNANLGISGTTLNSAVVTSSLTTVGTIGTGVWQATVIGATYGGTGVNNGTSTITLGGSVTFSGAYTFTGTLTAATSVTFPTSGTLETTTKRFTNVLFSGSSAPTSGAPTATTITGGDSPAEAVPVWQFSGSATNSIDYYGIIPWNYSGGGLTVDLGWCSTTTVAGDVEWQVGARKLSALSTSIGSAGTLTFSTAVVTTCPSGNFRPTKTTLTLSHSDLDSPSAGDPFILRIRRNGGAGNDTSAATSNLFSVSARET